MGSLGCSTYSLDIWHLVLSQHYTQSFLVTHPSPPPATLSLAHTPHPTTLDTHPRLTRRSFPRPLAPPLTVENPARPPSIVPRHHLRESSPIRGCRGWTSSSGMFPHHAHSSMSSAPAYHLPILFWFLTCFSKRTAKKADKDRRKPAPLPKVPPSLNVDIRNSLILPG